jgi:hypothetical protein
VTTSLTAEVALIVDEPAELVFSVAAAAGPEIIDERLECTSDGTPLAIEEFAGPWVCASTSYALQSGR